MFKNNRIVSIPDYVLFTYKEFISDNELFILMTLSVTATWAEAANKLGYPNTGPISRAVNSMKEKGLIVVNEEEIDVGVLWEKCKKSSYTPQKATLFKDVEEWSVGNWVYDELVEAGVLAGVGNQKYVWANGVKKAIKEGIAKEDIVGCATYLHSYFMNNPKFSDYQPKIDPHMILNNIEKWVSGGRKKEYKPEVEHDFSDLKSEL